MSKRDPKGAFQKRHIAGASLPPTRLVRKEVGDAAHDASAMLTLRAKAHLDSEEGFRLRRRPTWAVDKWFKGNQTLCLLLHFDPACFTGNPKETITWSPQFTPWDAWLRELYPICYLQRLVKEPCHVPPQEPSSRVRKTCLCLVNPKYNIAVNGNPPTNML